MTQSKTQREALKAARDKNKPAPPAAETSLPLDKQDLANLAKEKAPAPDQAQAQMIMERIRALKQEEVRETKRAEEKGKLFYLQCRYCAAPALFFTHNVRSEPFGPADWYSTYKTVSTNWVQAIMPTCQARGCGQMAPLKKCKDGIRYTVIGRFYRMIDESEIQLEEVSA